MSRLVKKNRSGSEALRNKKRADPVGPLPQAAFDCNQNVEERCSAARRPIQEFFAKAGTEPVFTTSPSRPAKRRASTWPWHEGVRRGTGWNDQFRFAGLQNGTFDDIEGAAFSASGSSKARFAGSRPLELDVDGNGAFTVNGFTNADRLVNADFFLDLIDDRSVDDGRAARSRVWRGPSPVN